MKKEDSTEALLREIEEEEAREEALREAAIADANARGETLGTGGAQLTDFQEQIITTGSGVGKAMLVLLIIAFVMKFITICYNYLKRKAALGRIKSAISTTKSRSVDEYDPNNPNFDRMEYIQYNAEFRTAVLMDEKIEEGKTDKRALTQLLHQRALEVLHRRAMLMRNEQYVAKSYEMNILPLEVWNDFQDAKESLQEEFRKLQYLAHGLGVSFQGLMETAKVKLQRKQKQGSMYKASKRESKYKGTKQFQDKRRLNGKNSNREVSGKSASSRPMTTEEKLASKGIFRRRKV